MSAVVVKTGPRAYQAWCEQCHDGVNSIRRACEKWADQHNAEKHPTRSPMWEAMDCDDVTDDPFYEDFR